MSDFQSFLDEQFSKLKVPVKKKEIEILDDNYDIYEEISKEIVEVRKGNKLSQKELAQMTGLSQANVSRIEQGIVKPTIDSLLKIANATGKRLIIEFEDREELI